MSRFLIATWDGAGNLVPTLALARRLARAGHDVRLLGHRSIERRCGTHGWRLRTFVHTIDVDSAAATDTGGGMLGLARDLWFSASTAADVREEFARESAEVLIADCMLFGALSAGQAAGIPTVALFHGAFTLFRRGPLADLLSSLLPELNALRSSLGLPAVQRIGDVHDACAMSVVAAPREFEPDLPMPANVRFAGPLLDGPPLLPSASSIRPRSGADPLVLVSLSTSDQGQTPVLQRLVAALSRTAARTIVTTGPALDVSAVQPHENVEVVRFVPHGDILARAALVVTHAGLGTVMTALAHGVPLLCIPFGRDQFFNAARVEALGAGRTVSRDADVDTLRAAARALLDDESVHAAAVRCSQIIRGYGNGAAAVREIEDLARSGCRAVGVSAGG